MSDIFLLALGAALNPTLVAASTLMMLLPNAKRLMFGYLLGALMTSITLGLLIISSLENSSAVATAKNTLSPAATLLLGVAALTGAVVVRRGWHPRAADRGTDKQGKKTPRWQKALGRGSASTTFVVGALLTLPGASYLAGLSRIDKLNYPTVQTVALVVAFNLIMLALLEIPLLGFVIAPDRTVELIDRTKVWTSRHRRRAAVTLLTVVGTLLVIKALIEFFS
jgi:drug/metabolite transporter (DMT)-like permease